MPRDAREGTSFGAAAELYQRSRPDYPLDLVTWLVCDAIRVVDVGAGTGKLTDVMRSLGRQVTAIDPDPRMLASLHDRLPEVDTRVGSAESLPLPDHCADLVTFGQAWHWVDPDRASSEADRVLAPDGVLGLIWNLRDESVPWVADLTTIIRPSAAEQLLAAGPPPFGPPFEHVEQHTVRWTSILTTAQLVDLASSRSHLLALPPAAQRQVLGEVAELAGQVAGSDDTIRLPYRTKAFRISRGR